MKYLYYTLIGLKNFNEFKFDFFFFWAETLVKCLVVYFFWFALWEGKFSSEFTTLTLAQFFSLLVFTQIFSIPIRNPENVAGLYEEAVISGSLSTILCKPIHPVWMNLAKVISQQVPYILIMSAVSILGALYLQNQFHIDWAQTPLLNYILLPFSLLMGYLIFYFFYTLIGITSFWIGDVWSILYICIIMSSFMSGQLFPLEIKPWMNLISQFLPFRYISYSPATLVVGTNGIDEFIKQFCMLLCLIFASLTYFKVALKHFEANGG